MPIQLAYSIIHLFISCFSKYRPRDSTGCWGYKLDTYLSSLSLGPSGGGSVACDGLEKVLGAKENIKEALNSAFQKMWDR